MAIDFQSRNLVIPRGVFFFAPFKPNTMTPGAKRQIGNCPEFSLGGDVERLDHRSSQRGISVKDESVITARNLTFNFSTDDIKSENMGLFLMSKSEKITVVAQTAVPFTLEAVELGGTYQLGQSDTNPTGHRNISDVTVTGGDEGVDYSIDAEYGLITILTGGALAEGSTVTGTYDVGASTYDRVIAGDTELEGELSFYSFNPHGPQEVVVIPRAKIGPNGEMPFMTDPESPSWRTLPLSGEVLQKGNMALVYRDGLPAVLGI